MKKKKIIFLPADRIETEWTPVFDIERTTHPNYLKTGVEEVFYA